MSPETPLIDIALNKRRELDKMAAIKEKAEQDKDQFLEEQGARVRRLIKTHVKFPEEVDGKKVKRTKIDYFLADYVQVGGIIKHQEALGPTQLACETPKLTAILSSNKYPFEERDDLDFNIFIPEINAAFTLAKGHGENLDGEKIKLLGEIFSLIENPETTTYVPVKPYFVKR